MSWSKMNPFPGKLISKKPITKPDSAKENYHMIVDIAGSEMTYEPGDSLGVYPENPKDVVEAFQKLFPETETVEVGKKGEQNFTEALKYQLDLQRPSTKLVKAIKEYLAEKPDDLQSVLAEIDSEKTHVLDILKQFPEFVTDAQQCVSLLGLLQPRLYSIASSPITHSEEIHLTVGTVRYDLKGTQRVGVATSWLADVVQEKETKLPSFMHHSRRFRLPENPETPMIMIGPGRGIAPFIGFLEHRQSQSDNPVKAWLFFGEQHAKTDFMYEEELKAFQEKGTLSQITTAFSRDQQEKIYVQHRMEEYEEQIWDWIENQGSHIYICGDGQRMAKDVDAVLLKIVQKFGQKTEDEAKLYIKGLIRSKRFQRDVY